MGQREHKSLQATRCANGGGEVRQTRRQAAFQLAVRSLAAINITHRDLPDGGGHPHACMLGACARLRCVIASTRECRRMHYTACIRVCYLNCARRANWEARARWIYDCVWMGGLAHSAAFG